MPEPECDDGDVDAGLKHVHRRRVAYRVGRYRAAAQGGKTSGRCDCGEVQALGYVRAGHLSAPTLGQPQTLGGGRSQSPAPSPDSGCGRSPERTAALFAALTEQVHARLVPENALAAP